MLIKDELNYKIDKFKPELLLSGDNEFDNFFLKLGLFFNDLKSCLNLIRFIQESDNTQGANSINGEIGGMRTMLEKTMYGYINEFFVLIEKNRSLIKTFKFQCFLQKIKTKNIEIYKNWERLYKFAIRDKNIKENQRQFVNIISDLRDHCFHYNNDLIDSFRKTFIDSKNKNDFNKDCSFNLGKGVFDSRLFYCDAIMQNKLQEYFLKIEKTKPDEKIDKDYLFNEVVKITNIINVLMVFYFDNINIKKLT